MKRTTLSLLFLFCIVVNALAEEIDITVKGTTDKDSKEVIVFLNGSNSDIKPISFNDGCFEYSDKVEKYSFIYFVDKKAKIQALTIADAENITLDMLKTEVSGSALTEKRRSLNFPWQAPEVLTKRWCNMIQDRTNFCTFAPMKKEPTTINKDFIISFFLPDGMTDWFEIVGMREEPNGGTAQTDVLYSSVLHIYLDERDNLIGDQLGLKPNGFTEATVIKDYPIRNRKVLLHVRRRRYLDADGRNIILNQYPLTADGTKLSVEFGLFFKDGDGQPSVDGSVIGKILSY